MGTYGLVVKDPNKAYLGTQLWLPLSKVNIRAIKASLEFEVYTDEGQQYLQLWEVSPHHIAVPREYVRREDYASLSFPIVDMRPTEFPRAEFKSSVILDFKDPTKDVQRQAFEAFITSEGGMLNLKCGGGKTNIALHAVAHFGFNTLIIVNQKTILSQWRERIDEFLRFRGGVGLVQGPLEEWDWKHPITIAMLHTLARHSDRVTPEMRRWFGTVIWDECFVAGTPVDGVPIEQRRVGDLIQSFDECTGQFAYQIIEKVFVSRPTLLASVYIDGEEFICTAVHPFWTQRGWVHAFALTCDDMVLCSNHEREHLCVWQTGCGERNGQALCKMPGSSARGAPHQVQQPMCQLPQTRVGEGPEADGAVPQKEVRLLLQRMYEGLCVGRTLETDDSDQQTLRSRELGAYAPQQPNEGSESPRKTTRDPAGHGVEASCSRRKWQATTLPPAVAGMSFGMADGGGCPNEHTQRVWSTNSLQDRHRQRDTEGRRRGRWRFTQLSQTPGGGQKERQFLGWKGVDRVAIHEPGGDGSFGGRCRDGLVYNLQVSNTPTYTIGDLGVVVHNCHHLSAPYFCITADMFQGRRYGLSATLRRLDGTEVIYNYHIGDAFYKDLQQEVKPGIYFRQLPYAIPPGDEGEILACNGQYSVGKAYTYVGQMPDRNAAISSDLIDALDAGRKILALSHSVKQLRLLNEQFIAAGYDSGICTGQQKLKQRWAALRDKRIVFGTHQLVLEAIDEDSLDTIAWLTPFGTYHHPDGGKNALQQGMGRIQGYRFHKGMKEPLVIFFDDIHIPKFHRMCNKLRQQLRRWPTDEGGPYDFKILTPKEVL